MRPLSKELLFITEYHHALENKDVNKLDQTIAELAKKCKYASIAYKQEIGKQCLKIFNLTNTQGDTAVMIAAGQGNAKMLKKWYTIPDLFVRSISPEPDKLQECYKQSNYSYTTQNKEGCNALMLACQSGNSDCIEYILSPEIKEILNQKDINNQTPIEYAIKCNVHKNNYDTIDEFIRVFTHVISKKSKYFPNECFHLDKRYVDVAYQMKEEDMKDNILNAYKKTNASNIKEVKQKGDISKTRNDKILGCNDSSIKVFKKRSRDFSDELEYSSNKRLKTNGTTTTSKLLEAHNSPYKPKESKSFAKAVIKSKASHIKSEQTKNLMPQDIDASKVSANNLRENSHEPGSSEYNKHILDKFKTFIDKINTSTTDRATQTALLYECRELFCLPNNSFPEEGIQFLHLVDDYNMRIEMIDTILGISNECNH